MSLQMRHDMWLVLLFVLAILLFVVIFQPFQLPLDIVISLLPLCFALSYGAQHLNDRTKEGSSAFVTSSATIWARGVRHQKNRGNIGAVVIMLDQQILYFCQQFCDTLLFYIFLAPYFDLQLIVRKLISGKYSLRQI